MARTTRLGKAAALLSALALLALPASVAGAGGGPTATKSGALVNYVTTGKLKIRKNVQILVVCSADCNVDSNSVIKGPRVRLPGLVTGSLQANVPGGPFFKPNRALLKAMKAAPGKFKLVNKIIATDPATGLTDSISRTFRFKR